MSAIKGKKGHPEYRQVTIYIKKTTHNKCKMLLLKKDDGRDFSDLVEHLLRLFLKVARI